MSNPTRFEYARGTLYNLTRTLLGEEAAEHGYRVSEALLNDAGASWSVAAVGQVHDLAEDTDLSVEDVANLVISVALNYMEQDYIGDEIAKALDGVTRREGEVYADFIERVRTTSHLAVAIKLADLRDNIARCQESDKGSLLRRYTRALARLEPVEPTAEDMDNVR